VSQAAFHYQGEDLWVEGVSLAELGATLGTPLYVYSTQALKANFQAYQLALKNQPSLIAYSVKAASNLAILHLLKEEGAGSDIVSGGELKRALQVGVDPQKIVFSGVGKTAEEMIQALKAGILMFNVESAPEMRLLAATARELGKKAPLALRVNPDVDPQTHPYIATGFRESKFGVPIEEALALYQEATADPYLEVVGLDCHIGSQLTSVSPFAAAAERLRALLARLAAVGVNIQLLDVGGGLGINYHGEEIPSPQELVQAFGELLAAYPGLRLILEPGRSIVGQAAVLLIKCLYNKVTPFKRFVITDGAMSDLIRPSLYGSYHEIKPVRAAGRPAAKVNVVGPICESGDFLAQDREIPLVESGEFLAVFGAGAYGFAMSSNYNSRPRPAEALVDGARFRVIRARETLEDLTRGETI
jgi:diaminopimelate decarboxylase